MKNKYIVYVYKHICNNSNNSDRRDHEWVEVIGNMESVGGGRNIYKHIYIPDIWHSQKF